MLILSRIDAKYDGGLSSPPQISTNLSSTTGIQKPLQNGHSDIGGLARRGNVVVMMQARSGVDLDDCSTCFRQWTPGIGSDHVDAG